MNLLNSYLFIKPQNNVHLRMSPPPSIEPKIRRRRAIPKRTTSVQFENRTEMEHRAIRSEVRRSQRLLHQTRQAALYRLILPQQQEVDRLLQQREQMGIVDFTRNNGPHELSMALHRLENTRQRVLAEYINPIASYNYFWRQQYHGNNPPGPPPPPPPGGGYINITNRLLS